MANILKDPRYIRITELKRKLRAQVEAGEQPDPLLCAELDELMAETGYAEEIGPVD